MRPYAMPIPSATTVTAVKDSMSAANMLPKVRSLRSRLVTASLSSLPGHYSRPVTGAYTLPALTPSAVYN